MNKWVLPVAMLVGGVLSGLLAPLSPATPYVLFVMLLVTFCRISPADMRFSPLVLWIIGVQIVSGVGLYVALMNVDQTVAQGVAICVYAPTGVAAMAVASMLGANPATMATTTFFSNLTVALLSPPLFALAGAADQPFAVSLLAVVSRVGPLLLIPLIASVVLHKFAPRLYHAIARRQNISFYLWAAALAVTTARTVEFIKEQSAHHTIVIATAGGALAVCILQFIVGRSIGRRWGDAVSGGQSLGQKNTLLAIWMAQTYFSPLASIGPASYVIWQNVINTLQMLRKK